MGFSNKLSWVALSIIGFVVIAFSTVWGIGLSPDSVVYIGGARNLAEGRGFSMPTAISLTSPIIWHAPLYSAVLSMPGLLFYRDPLESARWVNAFLFGVSIFLVCAFIAKNLAGRPRSTVLWLPIIGGWFYLTSPIMLEIYMLAWSEALFLVLGLSGLYLLAAYLENLKFENFFGAASLIALSMLTRYAGVVLGVSGVLAIALFLRKPRRSRIVIAFLFGVLSIVPLGLWLVRNLLVAGSATSREFSFHPIGKSQISQAITTITSWLLVPDTARTWVKLLLLLAVGFIILVAVRSMANAGVEIPLFVRILGIFIPIYFIFLAFSISFLDANTPFDGRILSPVYASGLIFFIVILGSVSLQFYRHDLFKRISLGLIALLSVVYMVRDGDRIANAYHNGVGFNSLRWRQSETLSLLEALPEGIPIFSNAPDAIYIHSNRPASRIPSKFESANQRATPEYMSILADVKNILQAKQGVIIYFNTVKQGSIPEAYELVQEMDLYLIHQAGDGAIYGVHSPR